MARVANPISACRSALPNPAIPTIGEMGASRVFQSWHAAVHAPAVRPRTGMKYNKPADGLETAGGSDPRHRFRSGLERLAWLPIPLLLAAIIAAGWRACANPTRTTL